MADLRRKVVALFFAVVFLAAVVVLPGCKGQSAPEKKTGAGTKTGTKQKLPADMQ
jgi:hypothetical protein